VIFPIPLFLSRVPVPSLRGATFRPKPVLPIRIMGPGGTDQQRALVDTGADDVVFPFTVALRVGLDLSRAPQGNARGVGNLTPSALYYAPVLLELDDGNEVCRWRAVVGFSWAIQHRALLGIAGGLEFFRTILDVEQRQIELIANPSLPRTQDAVP
jgi:hypothetical protein